MIKLLITKIGLDAITSTTIFTRIWTTASGLALIIAISFFLDPFEQGIYFLFVSLLGAQVLLELGLSFTLAQFTSHEFAHISWVDKNLLEGKGAAVSKVFKIFKFAMVWYSIIGILMLTLIFPVGILFIDNSSENIFNKSIFIAWGLYVITGAVNIIINAIIVLIESTGRVLEVARVRLLQAIFSTILIFTTLYLGGGVYALASGLFGYILIGALWLQLNYLSFLKQASKVSTEIRLIFKEIIPMQWRIAISWAFGYLTFYTFTPMIFYFVGGTESGRYGMSMQIFTALNSLGIAWITTKMPLFCELIELKQEKKLYKIFYTSLIQSTFVMIIINLLVLFIISIKLDLFQHFASRILPFNLMLLLCFSSILNHLIFSIAAVIRAQKIEPMLIPTIICGIAMLGLGWVLIPLYGISGAVWVYTSTTFIGLCAAIYIFKKYKNFLN